MHARDLCINYFHLQFTSNGPWSLAGTSHLKSHTAPPPTAVHPQMIEHVQLHECFSLGKGRKQS